MGSPMRTDDIQPIPNEPALLIKKTKTIVIADLHIGIENELETRGVHIPSQTPPLLDHLLSLIKTHHPKEIVLLGDIKHNIPSMTIQERIDVKRFFEKIKSYAEIHVVPGNHDGNIRYLLPSSVNLHPSEGFIYNDIGFIHGHRWPDETLLKNRLLVIGHTHPTIMLTDRLGYKTFEPCWLRGTLSVEKMHERYPDAKTKEIIVMPAFNPLCGGNAVNTQALVGPMGKIIDVPNALVYLLDGTCLGKVKDVR